MYIIYIHTPDTGDRWIQYLQRSILPESSLKFVNSCGVWNTQCLRQRVRARWNVGYRYLTAILTPPAEYAIDDQEIWRDLPFAWNSSNRNESSFEKRQVSYKIHFTNDLSIKQKPRCSTGVGKWGVVGLMSVFAESGESVRKACLHLCSGLRDEQVGYKDS